MKMAAQFSVQALSSFSGLNIINGQAFCRRGLGDLALLSGDYGLARRHFEVALSWAKEPFLHVWLISQTQSRLGLAMLSLGDIKAAEEHLKLAAYYARSYISDSKELPVIALTEIAALWLAKEELDRALALGTFAANYVASWHETKWRAGEIVTAAAKELPSADRSAAETRGRKMTLADALAFVGWD